MQDDGNGTAIDSGNEQIEESCKAIRESERSESKEVQELPGTLSSSNALSKREKAEIEPIIQTLSDGGIDEINSAIESGKYAHVLKLSHSEWNAPIPDPESFLAFPERMQDKIIEYADANILDESKRQDKLLDALIFQNKIDSIMTSIITLMGIALSFTAFVITQNPASFGLLGVSLFAIVINIYKDNKDEKSMNSNGKEKQ